MPGETTVSPEKGWKNGRKLTLAPARHRRTRVDALAKLVHHHVLKHVLLVVPVVDVRSTTRLSAASRSRNTQRTHVKKAWAVGWKLESQ